MEYQTVPKHKWSIKSNKTFNLYDLITRNYKDEDILFKIIKENHKILELSKIECINKAVSLASEILKLVDCKNNSKQLKVMGILSASEESAIFMLTSSYLASHHCICFEDLSEEAICQRIELFKPDIVLFREKIEIKMKAVEIINKSKDLIFQKINLKKELKVKEEHLADSYEINSSLFTLFTSGSTGLPKAIVHGGIDYINYAKFTTEYYFGIKKGSIMFSAVDAGWINGHTYSFYGPLLLGAKSIINEDPLLLTMPNSLGEYFEKLEPDCFYTSVTLIRLIKTLTPSGNTINDYFQKKYTNFRLERIGSCGEPLANSVGDWAIKFFMPLRKSIVNTYFQTETGGILVAPRDEDNPPKDYSCVGKPNSKIKIMIAKQIKTIEELEKEQIDPNELLICEPWDGIFQKVLSDRKQKYFTSSGEYRLHDVGYFDEEGYLYIGGRSDDVINVSGHRISSSEIENICMSVKNINEICAVAIPDEIAGSKVVLFFSSKELDEDQLKFIKSTLNNLIITKLSQYHIPKEIYFFNNFPKTKSGKIMRRIMRDIARNYFNEEKDYSTIANKVDFLKSKDNFFKGNK